LNHIVFRHQSYKTSQTSKTGEGRRSTGSSSYGSTGSRTGTIGTASGIVVEYGWLERRHYTWDIASFALQLRDLCRR